MGICPWCKRDQSEILGTKPDGVTLYKCQICGLIFQSGNKADKMHYTRDYYEKDFGNQEKQQIRYQLVQYITGGFKGISSVLDVGCGAGLFLEKVAKSCPKATGLDKSPWSVDICKAKGLEIYNEQLETFYPKEKYDLVTAWEVVEHIEDLRSFLNSVKKIMSDIGIFMLSTPNVSSYRAKKYGLEWKGFCWRHEHLCYFSAPVLECMLKEIFTENQVQFVEFDWRSEDTLVAIVKNNKETFSDKPQKALFVGRTNGLEVPGGDMVQLFNTKIAIEKRGFTVDVSLSALPALNFNYDVIHQFGLSHAEAVDQFFHLEDKCDHAVLSPIYWNPDETKRSTEEIAEIAKQSKNLSELKEILGLYGQGKVMIEGLRNYSYLYEKMREERHDLISKVKHFLPNSYAEMHELRRDFGLFRSAYTVVPNAVDVDLFLNADPSWFVREYGIKDFVLCAARLEPRKNQLMLLLAMQETALPCVIIGRSQVPEYAELCHRYAPSGTVFLDNIPQDLLASAYKAARVHALVSWSETPGLSSLEAALGGCSIVVSDRGPTWEYFGDMAYYCDPGNINSIRDAVLQAWENHFDERQASLRELIVKKYTWDKAAECTLQAYKKVTRSKTGSYVNDDRMYVIRAQERKTSLCLRLGDAKKIAIFGASLTGRECYESALEGGLEVKFFLDNSPARQGTSFLGLPVYSVDYIVRPGAEEVDAVILASAGYHEEMARQLIELGCRKPLVRP